MINDKNLNQEGGKQSTNFQGQNVNVYQGLTYSDAKEIALDVFKSNFIHLKNEAAQIAAERAEEITENILSKLNEKAPESLKEFEKPAMQDALYTAQKEFAKSGDKDLGDLLVDIIVDRAKVPQRNMLQIVLDESLLIAPKLTVEQLDTLTLIFLLTRTKRLNLTTYKDFLDYLNSKIFPFVENTKTEHEYFSYLEYLRCGQIRLGNYGELENNYRNNYKGIFSVGFSKEEYIEEFGEKFPLNGFLVKSFFDNNKVQLVNLESNILNNLIKVMISESDKIKVDAFIEKTSMTPEQIHDHLCKVDENMIKIFDIWKNSEFRQFELSQVGIAIAHANYRRRTNETMDLSKWIK